MSLNGGGGGPAAGRNGRGAQGEGRPRKRLAGVARGGGLNLAGAVVSAAATVGTTMLVTRGFSESVAGAFFTATSLFLIIESTASLGAFNGLVYFIARLRSLGEVDRIPVIMRAAFIPVLIASVIGAAGMVVFAHPLASLLLGGHLARGGATPAAVAAALRALAFSLPFATMVDTFLGACRGYREMRPTVLVDRLGRSAGQLIGVGVAVAASSVALLAPLWAVAYIPAAVAAWFFLHRVRRGQQHLARMKKRLMRQQKKMRRIEKRKGYAPAPAVPDATLPMPALSLEREPGARLSVRRLANANPRGFWRFTSPRAVASLAQITIQRVDIVLVAVMRGPAEAAVYTAATRFLVAGQFANSALSMAAQPRLAEFLATGERREANHLYRATTAWLVLLTWPLYLLAIAYGPEVLSIFGHSYRAGGGVMVVLSLAMLVATACGQVDVVLITTGRSSWSLANGLLAVVLNVGIDVVLIPRQGILGAAIGWAVAIATTNLLPLAQIAITARLNPFGRGTITACVVTALSFAAIPLTARTFLGSGAAVSITAVAAGCILMAAGLLAFRHVLALTEMPGVSRLRRLRRKATPGPAPAGTAPPHGQRPPGNRYDTWPES